MGSVPCKTEMAEGEEEFLILGTSKLHLKHYLPQFCWLLCSAKSERRKSSFNQDHCDHLQGDLIDAFYFILLSQKKKKSGKKSGKKGKKKKKEKDLTADRFVFD